MKNTIVTPLFFILFLAFFNTSYAQKNTKNKPKIPLWEFLKKGKLSGQSRTYFMMTDNEQQLKDFYTLGTGLGIRYESPKFWGFQFAIGANSIFNIASTPLDQADTTTGKVSRYELGLFDVTDPKNRTDLNKLEELYLRYTFRKSTITVGRQLLKTPFINPQNGRIRPTFEEGVWLDINELKSFKFNLGYLWRMAPRSTVKWYNIGKSIGLYPVGKNPDGSNSGYKNNLKSAGILLGSAQYKTKNWSIQVWDQFVENIFNTVFVQADWKQALDSSKNTKLIIGLQGAFQHPLNNGGNEVRSQTYFMPDQQTWIVSGRLGLQVKKLQFNFNYTHIFDSGRFMMPREWGREPFYTFIPRERNEGTANVHGFATNWIYNFKKIGLKTRLSYGYYLRPDAKNFELNKYAMPSYGHLLVMLDKTFQNYLKGLHFKLIYMYKHNAGETYNNPNFIYNKVNMHHLDFMINYNF